MQAGDLKTLAVTLLLPPAGPILLALIGVLALRAGRRAGAGLALLGLALLWVFSMPAVSVLMARHLLPEVRPAGLADLRRARVEAVVVLGGGVYPQAPEYGQPQPSAATLERLRLGTRLARQAGLPMAFSGGVGWAGRDVTSEAEVARNAARQDFGVDLRWIEDRSRDTRENAVRTAALLGRDRIRRVALVTHAWHMPRAELEFRRAGFEVLAAPTGLPGPQDRDALEWLPSPRGLAVSRLVLREWLALAWLRWR